jgi:hypothetical protein
MSVTNEINLLANFKSVEPDFSSGVRSIYFADQSKAIPKINFVVFAVSKDLQNYYPGVDIIDIIESNRNRLF